MKIRACSVVTAAMSFLCCAGMAFAQAPEKLHIVRSSVTYGLAAHNLTVWGTIDGQKIELVAVFGSGVLNKEPSVLPPGDYTVTVEPDKNVAWGVRRKYDVEVAPGVHQTFLLSGLSE